MTVAYRRAGAFDQEEIEDELVLMELESQAVVTLNRTGQMVWEALEAGATFDQLEEMFHSAFPDVGPDVLRRDIQGVLDTLLGAGLVAVNES